MIRLSPRLWLLVALLFCFAQHAAFVHAVSHTGAVPAGRQDDNGTDKQHRLCQVCLQSGSLVHAAGPARLPGLAPVVLRQALTPPRPAAQLRFAPPPPRARGPPSLA